MSRRGMQTCFSGAAATRRLFFGASPEKIQREPNDRGIISLLIQTIFERPRETRRLSQEIRRVEDERAFGKRRSAFSAHGLISRSIDLMIAINTR